MAPAVAANPALAAALSRASSRNLSALNAGAAPAAPIIVAGVQIDAKAGAAGEENAKIGLPDGWKAVWSTSRAVWYWRAESGQVAWEKPVSLSAAKSSRSLGLGAGDAASTPATTPAADADPAAAAEADAKADLPPGWTATWSRSKGRWYWRRGDETTWTKPTKEA
jgi:hypothetical protein